MKIKDFRANDKEAKKAVKGDLVTFKLEKKVRENDAVYRVDKVKR